ncbi:YkvA family protein [Phycicoccus sp. 3266]|uniref:YkvA family protein n=1 Tax=Phycicoccus sp. 3266 TaxID=2817751 RepID=UPI00286217DC|nr:YkvA family protein [Phycicoccus sp. 3266]MDR6865304.1 uncharacterized membrane protein YkvA (DUF1232 family) [Phycicoccus sp. 3266]
MATTTRATRLNAFRSIFSALRIASRPGSAGMGERLASLPRLARATFSGEYTGSSRGRLLAMVGAVLYVVSPVDLVPEAFLSVLGLADDAVVLSWIAAAVVNETESFLAWERMQPGRTRTTGRPGAARETVDGHVVR